MFILMNAVALMMVPENWVGLSLLLVGVAISTQYAFSIIEYSVEASEEPPGLSAVFGREGIEVLFQRIAIVVVMGGLTLLGYLYLPISLFVPLVGLILLIFPACIIAVVLDRSIVGVLNPERLVDIVRAIGWAYAFLYFLIVIGLLFVLSFVGLFVGQLPEQVFEFLVGGLSGYYYFLLFRVIGYVIFQYQSELGYVAVYEPTKKMAGKKTSSGDPLSVKIDIFLKEGRYQEVAALLKAEIKKPGSHGKLHDKFYKLMVAMDNQRAIMDHADEYLQLQVTMGRMVGMPALLQAYITIDPDYKPKEPELCFRLAKGLFGLAHYREVFHLLHRLHVRSPEFQELPDAYLLLAKALGDGLKFNDKAQSYLKYILKAFPETPQAEQAQTYLETFS
ncbi:MAG: hypothetical protein JKY67_07560 [Pseudomonadales bacterium]|nr:hypothetical protein [Pseudomonadales bacterium]